VVANFSSVSTDTTVAIAFGMASIIIGLAGLCLGYLTFRAVNTETGKPFEVPLNFPGECVVNICDNFQSDETSRRPSYLSKLIYSQRPWQSLLS
jgi:hypothetical protein